MIVNLKKIILVLHYVIIKKNNYLYFFIMTNIKKNYFNPGRLEKRKGQKISQFPQGKKSQNPNYTLSFNIKKQKTFVGVKPIVNKQSQLYKKKW
jgi:hypothetical protein